MKRRLFTFLVPVFLLLGGCQVIEPVVQLLVSETGKANAMFVRPFQTTTIMTWNIRAGRGLNDVRDLTRVAAVIKEADADFVALQEVDRNTTRADGVDQLTVLAEATGLVPTWGKALDFDGGEYGVALLSRAAPLRTQVVPLTHPDATEARVLLLVEFSDCIVGVTHLPLHETARLAAVKTIRAALPAEKPCFLAGDWNDEPASETLRALRGPFALLSGVAPTFPANAPTRCLDYIAVLRRYRARYEGVSHEVLPEAVASDHRPVCVTFRQAN